MFTIRNFMRPRMLPDLLILGAQRSGTTWLYSILASHPEVAVGQVKEPQALTLFWPEAYDVWSRLLPPRRGRHDRRLRIDASPYMLAHPLAPARAAQIFPKPPKMIVLLRDPVARAWSHYCHELAAGREFLGFTEALQAEAERLSGEAERFDRIVRGLERDRPGMPHQCWSYTERGRYAQQLDRWRRHFPPAALLILRSEDLFKSPGPTLATVGAFLGLEGLSLPATELRRNAGPAHSMPDAAQALLRQYLPDGPAWHDAYNNMTTPLPDGQAGSVHLL